MNEPALDEAQLQDSADSEAKAALTAKLNATIKNGDDELLQKLITRAKEDPDFADAAYKEIQAAKIVKFPTWLRPISLFDAVIDFGGGSTITISTTTFGNRIKTSLSTRMLRMQQALDRTERKIKPLMDAGKSDEIDASELDERNRLIGELGIAQTVESLSSMIIGGTGQFDALSKIKQLAENKDDASFAKASQIVQDLPQKAVDIITHAIRLMNNYGLDDKNSRGN